MYLKIGFEYLIRASDSNRRRFSSLAYKASAMDPYASPECLVEIKGIEPYAVARTRCFPGMDYRRLVLISISGGCRDRTDTPVSRYQFSRLGRYLLRFNPPICFYNISMNNKKGLLCEETFQILLCDLISILSPHYNRRFTSRTRVI